MFFEIYARYQAFPQIKHLREISIGYFSIKRATSSSNESQTSGRWCMLSLNVRFLMVIVNINLSITIETRNGRDDLINKDLYKQLQSKYINLKANNVW